MKKGLSAEAYLEPLFQKSQKNLEHLKSLKHNSHPWLSQPFLSEMFNVQSEQIPPGNCSLHWALVLSAWVELRGGIVGNKWVLRRTLRVF